MAASILRYTEVFRSDGAANLAPTKHKAMIHQVPLFYRMHRAMAPGEARRVRPDSVAEREALVALRGRVVVVCPRFPSPHDAPTIQGVPVQMCSLCRVDVDPGDDALVTLVHEAPVEVVRLLQDVDATECLMVDADVRITEPAACA